MAASDIVKKWQGAIEGRYERWSPHARNSRVKLKEAHPLKVWLGSPRRGSVLPRHGLLLKSLLEGEKCTVDLSHLDDGGGNSLEAEPCEIAAAYDLLFLVAASPGTSVEAMELSLLDETKRKIHVFLPIQFREGYLAKSLGGRHKVLSHQSYFCLEKAEIFDPELPMNMIEVISIHRGKLAVEKGINAPPQSTTTINQTIHMGDNISASNSTIINRSEVTNALNVVKNKHGKATMDFLTTVADHVEKSGRKGAGQLLDLFNEELARKEPREPVLKSTWEKIVELVPSLSTIANVAIEIAKLCGSGS